MMSQGISMRQQMDQNNRLALIVELSNLLAVPDEVLGVVGGAISYNPDAIELILRKRKEVRGNIDEASARAQAIYAAISRGGSNSDESGKRGLIISPDLAEMADLLGNRQICATPDVTYVGRKDNKPEIILSDHLRGGMNLSMVMVNPEKYPETARLIKKLGSFDDWKRRTLTEAYGIIGEKQREYFESFDCSRFCVFNTRNLAEELDIDESTVARVTSNRWVEGRNISSECKAIRTKDLLITADDVRKIGVMRSLNGVLENELSRGEAYSDRELAERAGNISRRTVTKYRTQMGIPESRERKEIYEAKQRTEPFRFPEFL